MGTVNGARASPVYSPHLYLSDTVHSKQSSAMIGVGIDRDCPVLGPTGDMGAQSRGGEVRVWSKGVRWRPMKQFDPGDVHIPEGGQGGESLIINRGS